MAGRLETRGELNLLFTVFFSFVYFFFNHSISENWLEKKKEKKKNLLRESKRGCKEMSEHSMAEK